MTTVHVGSILFVSAYTLSPILTTAVPAKIYVQPFKGVRLLFICELSVETFNFTVVCAVNLCTTDVT